MLKTKTGTVLTFAVAGFVTLAALSCGGGKSGTEPVIPVTNGERFNAIRPIAFFGLQIILANLGTQHIEGIDPQQTTQSLEQLAPFRISSQPSLQQVPTYNPATGWWSFDHTGTYSLRGYSIVYTVTDSVRYRTSDGTNQQEPTTKTLTLENNATYSGTYSTLESTDNWNLEQQITLSELTSPTIKTDGIAELTLATEFVNDSGDVISGAMSIELALSDWVLYNEYTSDPCPTGGNVTFVVIENFSAQAVGGTPKGETRWDITMTLLDDGSGDVTATGPGSFTAGGTDFICVPQEPPPDSATTAERYDALENLIQLGVELALGALGTQHISGVDTAQSFGGLARLSGEQLPLDQVPTYDPVEGWWWFNVTGDYTGDGGVFTVAFDVLDSVQFRDTLLDFQENPDDGTVEIDTRRLANLLYEWPDTVLEFNWGSRAILSGLTGNDLIADCNVNYTMDISTINHFGSPVDGAMTTSIVVREIDLANMDDAHPCPTGGSFDFTVTEDFAGQLAGSNPQGDRTWYVVLVFLADGLAEKQVYGPGNYEQIDTVAACGNY